jgi:2-oxoisovalerate dehydrogenase E2 component (dihydrolipoyl transacylase)
MGRYFFKLPDVGEGTAEAEIVKWHVALGENVAEDQLLVDVMTDKATVELTSPVAGRVVALNAGLGEQAAVGAPLVEFDLDGDGDAPAADAAPEPKESAVTAANNEAAGAAARAVLAAPAVRQRAAALGIALDRVSGSGPGGRIRHADLDALLRPGEPSAAPVPASLRQDVEDIPVIGLRRRIAERMADSKRRVAHFSYVEEIDLTQLESLRRHLNATYTGRREKLTLLPFLTRAMVAAIADFPQMNALFDDAAMVIHRHSAVHLGIATQTDSGLMVPVLRHAESCDLWQLAAAIGRLAQAARDGSIAAKDLSGSTITLTSLGALGGIVSTPVINLPEVAIIGVNKLAPRPMVVDGQVVVRSMMNLSSSFDHRVVDGADAARFVQAIKTLLEQPASLFLV